MMRIIAIEEKEIQQVIDQLELEKFRNLKGKESIEYNQAVSDVHRKFHFIMVRFFQDQGSSFPNS